MPGVLLILIDLNEIQFETNGLEMIVENKTQSFKNLHEWMKAVGLSKTLINVLIYDEREVFSISKQDSLNLLNNLDYFDFSYIYDNLFWKTNFHSHLKSLNKKSLKINQDFLLNKIETKNSADSVNYNQSWNKTIDEFTCFGGMETQRMCDEVKVTYKLKYNYNIAKWWIIMILIVSNLCIYDYYRMV